MPSSIHLTRLAAVVLSAGIFAFPACESSFDRIEDYNQSGPATVADDVREVRAPDGFDFLSSRSVEVDLRAVQPESTQTLAHIGVALFTTDARGNEVELARGATDENGKWAPYIMVPADRDSVTLRLLDPGYPSAHRIAVGNTSRAMSYTLGADTNLTGRVLPEPMLANEMEPAPGITPGSERTGSRAQMTYMGRYWRSGRPTYLTGKEAIDDDLVEFINANLPETSGVPDNNPHFLDASNQGSVLFREEGELYISFAHEGAGYLNSLGYFTYDLANPPATKFDIDVHTIVFPNASFRGSGGGMRAGDRVYLGKFPAGTGVGWFLVPNGYDTRTRRVADKWNTRYSIDALNTFSTPTFQKHAVLLANNVRERLVLGFDDQNRPGGDNDFNDAVFVVEPTPWSSVDISNTPAVTVPGSDMDNDGVHDADDMFPNDAERAYVSYAPAKDQFGTIAFEDMWPKQGDYDFNDLVVDYSFTETLNAQNEVKDIDVEFSVRALGGSQDHGFALNLPIPPALIESVTGQDLKDNDYITLASNGTEVGTTTSMIPAFTSGFQLYGQKRGIINTDPAKPKFVTAGSIKLHITLRTPQSRQALGAPPYDPFMMRSRDRSREIHLAGKAPTSRANIEAFGTEFDTSDPTLGRYYIDEHNLPWALDLPASMLYPKEQVRIDEVYKDFTSWATFGGSESNWWFRDNGTSIDETNSY